MNAITPLMLTQLNDELKSADDDPDVRVVVLSGAGGAFCSAVDLKQAVAGEGGSVKVDDTLNAAQCLEYGLVNKAVPAGQLERAVTDWAGRIAGNAPLAVMDMKRPPEFVGK